MKKAKILLSLLFGAVLTVSVLAFTACGPEEQPGPEPSKTVLEFVAADKTNWDKEVTLGEKKFKMLLALNTDKTLTLSATCTGKAESSGGGGGTKGDGPKAGSVRGFGAQAVYSAAALNEAAGEDGNEDGKDEETEEETDFTAYNFTVNGTWSEEAGWGYTVKFDDKAKTQLVVDYDTTMGRHYFYYYMSPVIDGKEAQETQVQFQAKDSAYRKTLNSSYVINEERVATYMFRGGGFDSMTGNKAEARLYLMPDKSVVIYSESGSTLTYSAKGSWSADTDAHVIAMTLDGKEYTTNSYCDTKGKEGYRMTYSGYSVYCAVAAGMTWDLYTSADFEGATILTLESADYTLELTEKGYANIIKDGSVALATGYATDEEGNYEITTQYGTYTSVKEGNSVTFEIHIPVSSGFGPGAHEVETTVIFTGTAAA